MKLVLASPTLTRPFPKMIAAVEASIPALDAAGIEHQMLWEVGCPYISHARATMLRKALDAGADAVVFLDHDLSWDPEDLVILARAEGDVVAGLYRYKKAEEEYMGVLRTLDGGAQIVRPDGAMLADKVPAGFLKVTKEAVHRFMAGYPELIYGHRYNPSIDLFNHGAFEGVWYGEDMSFSRRWRALGEQIHVVPDLNLTHHGADGASYPGNFADFLLRQPGGLRHGLPAWWDLNAAERAAYPHPAQTAA